MAITLTGSGPIEVERSKPEGIAAIAQHQYGREWKWELTVTGNLQLLIEDICDGNRYAVSDGSFRDGRGAAAWIIEGRTNQNRIVGKCFSPSSNDGHSSFRSELAGVYATLFTISMIIQQNTDPTFLQLACDGKSVLQRLVKPHMTDPAEAHADLLSATRHLMHKSNLSITLQHVKGHQDSKSFSPFTRDASLNIEADLLAKSKLESYQTGPSTFQIPWSQGVCYLGMKRVEKAFANEIRDYINGQRTQNYWMKWRSMTQGIWQRIDWTAVGQAMNEVQINCRQWIAKYVSGHFATGKNMCQWKFRTSSKCPRCNATEEDKRHILTCPAPEAQTL